MSAKMFQVLMIMVLPVPPLLFVLYMFNINIASYLMASIALSVAFGSWLLAVLAVVVSIVVMAKTFRLVIAK